MKIKMIHATLGLCALLLSGCYTVLYGPRTAVDLLEEAEPAAVETPDQYKPPVLGQYDEYEKDDWEDFYRYPGLPGGYGGGYGYGGYPYYGYGSGYTSAYDYYGYGPYPYYGYYGYGPYSYGYDPYYRSGSGYYVPVSRTLVTQQELDQLRASQRLLDELQSAQDPALAEQQRLEQERKEQEAWTRRTAPQVRVAPVATPQETAPSSSPSTYSPPPATSKPAASSSSSSGSSSSSSSTKDSSPPPKKTRR